MTKLINVENEEAGIKKSCHQHSVVLRVSTPHALCILFIYVKAENLVDTNMYAVLGYHVSGTVILITAAPLSTDGISLKHPEGHLERNYTLMVTEPQILIIPRSVLNQRATSQGASEPDPTTNSTSS